MPLFDVTPHFDALLLLLSLLLPPIISAAAFIASFCHFAGLFFAYFLS